MKRAESSLGIERVCAALIPMGVGAVLLNTALRGVGAGPTLCAGFSAASAAFGAIWLAPRLPASLEGAFRKKPLLAVMWLLVGLASMIVTLRLSTFMLDETRAECSIYPFDDFFVHHSCLSAHYQSAALHRSGVPNVYERTNYEEENGDPKFIDSFAIDVFLYPPPMLLLSRLALWMSGDFAVWRAVWFGVEGAIVGFALIAIGRWIGGSEGERALLLAPLVWLAIPTLLTLQIGNLHLAAVAASMLAMLAFERRHHALGGALLAALTWFKFFPGILIVLLLFQRRWRSVAWTGVFGVLVLGLAFLVLGAAPFEAFLSYQLPRLASGAAFESLFAHPDTIAANHSIFGLVQKLSLLGVPGMSDSTAARVSWVYTLALIGLTAIAAKVDGERLPRALVWITLIQLASLRSPFTPDTYAEFPLVWILTLLLAAIGWQGWRTILLASLLLLANIATPTVQLIPLTSLLTATLVLQLLFFTLYVWVLLALRRRCGEMTLRGAQT